MGDRELLEWAAKARGDLMYVEDCASWIEVDQGGSRGAWWNPLTDDGDALRLAVKLGLSVRVKNSIHGTIVGWFKKSAIGESHGTDPYAATRRAIVRAAAEIGKAMAPSTDRSEI